MKKMLALFACVGLSTLSFAQDKPAKPTEKPAAPAPAAPAAGKVEAVKASPEAEALMLALAKKLADKDGMIRDMSEAALLKAGKASLPTLNALASGQDKDVAAAAKKLADRIEKGGDRPQGGMRGGDATARLDGLAKELNLDEKKTQKLKDAQKAATDKMGEIREATMNGEMSREEAMAAMMEAREEIKTDLKKSGFSDEEIKKIESSLLGGRMGGGRGQGGGGGRGGRGGGGGI